MTDPAPPAQRPVARPKPDGLATAGAALWEAVAGVLQLEEHEALKLLQVCRTADLLDVLQAEVDRDGAVIESPQGRKSHPAAVELRQQRVTFARLVSDMRLPAGLAAAKAKGQQQRPAVKGVYAVGGGNA